MKLKIKACSVVSVTKYPKQDDCNQVLLVTGLLTPPIAEKLGIKEGAYNDEGVPRHLDTFPCPALRIDGADVSLGDKEYRATLIHKLKVKQPKTGGDTDTTLELTLRMHFEGKVPLFAWVENQKKAEFVLGINARQEDLQFGDAEEEADDPDPDPPEEQLEILGAVASKNSVDRATGEFQRKQMEKVRTGGKPS
jgi:hypothetical protein